MFKVFLWNLKVQQWLTVSGLPSFTVLQSDAKLILIGTNSFFPSQNQKKKNKGGNSEKPRYLYTLVSTVYCPLNRLIIYSIIARLSQLHSIGGPDRVSHTVLESVIIMSRVTVHSFRSICINAEFSPSLQFMILKKKETKNTAQVTHILSVEGFYKMLYR